MKLFDLHCDTAFEIFKEKTSLFENSHDIVPNFRRKLMHKLIVLTKLMPNDKIFLAPYREHKGVQRKNFAFRKFS